MTQAGSWGQPLKCLERLSNGGRGVTPLSLGEEGFCPQRNAGRRGLTCTPPSEATFRREADCTRGCVAGRECSPGKVRVSVVEMGKLKVDLAVDGHEARRSHMAVYCKIPLQRPFRSLAWPPQRATSCPPRTLSCCRPRVGMCPRKGGYTLDPSCPHRVGGKTPPPPERGG